MTPSLFSVERYKFLVGLLSLPDLNPHLIHMAHNAEAGDADGANQVNLKIGAGIKIGHGLDGAKQADRKIGINSLVGAPAKPPGGAKPTNHKPPVLVVRENAISIVCRNVAGTVAIMASVRKVEDVVLGSCAFYT